MWIVQPCDLNVQTLCAKPAFRSVSDEGREGGALSAIHGRCSNTKLERRNGRGRRPAAQQGLRATQLRVRRSAPYVFTDILRDGAGMDSATGGHGDPAHLQGWGRGLASAPPAQLLSGGFGPGSPACPWAAAIGYAPRAAADDRYHGRHPVRGLEGSG